MDNFSDSMSALFAGMQKAYDDVAHHYGDFSCIGCDDNCCTQRFFHHTVAEYRYLKEGMMEALKTDPDLVRQILINARDVVKEYAGEVEAGELKPLMCPVNFDGLCKLYLHRPMICRMHGMPHRFRLPNGIEERGGGCAKFGAAHKIDWTVNRTALYKELSAIEREERQRMGMSGKYAENRDEFEESTRLFDVLKGHLAADSGNSVEKISKAIEYKNVWMSPTEAKEFGLVDHIVGTDDASKADAKTDSKE